MQAERSAHSPVAYDLRFPGQVFDGQAGLHQNWYRDLDPATGKYWESAPLCCFIEAAAAQHGAAIKVKPLGRRLVC